MHKKSKEKKFSSGKGKFQSIFTVRKKEILIEIKERLSLDETWTMKQRSKFKDKDKWCDFHKDLEHFIEDCQDLDIVL